MLSTIQSFICNEDTPVVQTKEGKLRGMIADGIYTFRGIQYAKAERFQPPRRIDPWEGIVDCQDYGYVAPLIKQPRFRGDAVMLHRYWTSHEDCLYLNVWSSSMDPKAKKPVMVWLHGGGFSMGSSNEMYSYEGENMARDKNVVMVTLNHRLSILGYLDLSAYGEQYSASGIAGMQDIVEALHWVRDNIAQFGGDPDNVTIFGQSGGGKVQTLMQMPSADGLYHRAIIMSGVLSFSNNSKETARKTAERIIEKIGGLENLLTKDFFYLAEAAAAVEAEYGSISWAPVSGCGDYAGGWDQIGFRPETARIPVMVGTVINEFFFDKTVFNRAALNEEQLIATLAERYGEDVREAKELFCKAYPGINPYYAKGVDARFRLPTLRYIDKRLESAEAPVYNYVTAHESAYKGGRITNHYDDLPFVFRNEGGYGALHNWDTKLDKKKILVCAIGVTMLAFLGYSFAQTPMQMFAARLIHGLGMGFTTSTCLALASEALPANKLTQGIGYYSLAQTIASAVGPSLGLSMVKSWGYSNAFRVGATVMFVAAVLAATMRTRTNAGEKPVFRFSLSAMIAKEALVPAAFLFFMSLTYGTISSFLVIYAESVRGVEQIGLYFTLSAVCLLVTRPLIGRLGDKYGIHRVLLPGFGLFALAMVIISVADSLPMFLLAAVVNSFGYGAAQPIIQALSMKSVPSERRGVASTTSYIGTDVGYLIGSPIAGSLASWVGYSAMFRIMVLPIAMACVLFLLFYKKIKAISEE